MRIRYTETVNIALCDVTMISYQDNKSLYFLLSNFEILSPLSAAWRGAKSDNFSQILEIHIEGNYHMIGIYFTIKYSIKAP